MKNNQDNRLFPELEKQRESQLLDLLAPFAHIKPPFHYSATNRCIDRGLIPECMFAYLETLEFLCATVLSAQKAQRIFGVRASVLLAMAMDEASYDFRGLTRDPNMFCDYDPKLHSVSREIDRWFMRRAKQLTAKRFQKALNSTNALFHLKLLSDLGYYDRIRGEDLCSIVTTNNLEECDLAGMLPIGEYPTKTTPRSRTPG